MAASKTQGAVSRMQENCDESCSTVGGVGYGVRIVSWSRFPCQKVQVAPPL
ncbi:ZNF277 isoform 2 [Pongo abelii]|uniref:ZNF277 isoform 2 n=1 Tax=Pongo abelii TaxID=9601 RepID=A0A2J8T9Z6_PONAB|nr:ZNF277 isoform 2 [Pongo abelii]